MKLNKTCCNLVNFGSYFIVYSLGMGLFLFIDRPTLVRGWVNFPTVLNEVEVTPPPPPPSGQTSHKSIALYDWSDLNMWKMNIFAYNLAKKRLKNTFGIYGNPTEIPTIRKNQFRVLRSLKLCVCVCGGGGGGGG